jgi:Sec-independent protein secretion pathway component TatC
MNEEILKALSVILSSSLKHTLVGIPLAATYGFKYWQIVLYTVIGGVAGLLVFMFLEQQVERLWRRFFPLKEKKKVFTRKTRFIIFVKKNFGLYGIAFLTPAILSIPVGTVIASALYKDKRRVFIFITVAIIFWSLLGGALANEISQWVNS